MTKKQILRQTNQAGKFYMELSWTILNNLEKKYGDAFYLLMLNRFQENFRSFQDAFRSYYPNSHIAYSYKTNYIPQIVKSVNDAGGFAEVVSEMEYDLAVRIGVPEKKIIFNGPYKTEQHLRKALIKGAVVNIDSLYEVTLIEKIAKHFPQNRIKTGLRVNFFLSEDHFSKFGLDFYGDEIVKAFDRLRNIPNCEIKGLHCHFSTLRRSADSYRYRAEKMIKAANRFFPDSPPSFIDLGGGFFSQMSDDLKKQFGINVPSFKDYAEAIAGVFLSSYPSGQGPMLILEPGTALTADIMKFSCKVMGFKKIRSQKIALLSGSVYNIKPTLNDKNLPLRVYHQPGIEKPKEGCYHLSGYTCRENDYLYMNYTGSLSIDDYVVFDNVGAYTVVLKPPFILPNVPVLNYEESTQNFYMIKRKETLSDVFQTFTFD
jgi:diaminopimelate decarboxylase